MLVSKYALFRGLLIKHTIKMPFNAELCLDFYFRHIILLKPYERRTLKNTLVIILFLKFKIRCHSMLAYQFDRQNG